MLLTYEIRKSLRLCSLRDELVHSRYHPDYPIMGSLFRAPTSPIPVTGETVSHYSRHAFTGPTQESDRPNLSHRFSPTTGSLKLPEGASFPSMSLLYGYLSLNHKPACLSTGSFSILQAPSAAGFGRKILFFLGKTFDFFGRTW